MNVFTQLKDQKKPIIPIKTNSSELSAFYIVEIENGDFNYELDLTDLISYNLQLLDDMEKSELAVQMERISSVMLTIVSSSKYLKSQLFAEKIDYRVWKAEATAYGRKQFYLMQEKSKVPKAWLKAPTKDELIDSYLEDSKYRDDFMMYEGKIETLINRISFLDIVRDILKNRTIAIQSILKQEGRPSS